MERRAFLGGAIAAGVGLTAAPALASELANAMGGSPAAWAELQGLLGGQVYLPNDDGFGLAARVNNLRYMSRLPRAVAVVNSAERAASAISWCRIHDVAFRIKGGGHSYAGYSAGPELVIFTHGMNNVKLDADKVAHVGAGAINYTVYDHLAAANRTMTHGRCPTVGVAGFLLGGGIGFDMRRYGVASDSVTSCRVVLADGQLVTASEEERPDLFWALRGGAGGNFGLCTGFSIKTHDVATEELSVFQRYYFSDDQAATAQLLAQIMAECEAAPRELGTRISVQYLDRPHGSSAPRKFRIDLIGQWAGPAAWLKNMLDGFDKIVRGEVILNFRGDYWAGQQLLEEPEELFFYQERSTFIPQSPDAAAIAEALDHLRLRPAVHGPCDLRFFQTGGAINDFPPEASAFVHRSSNWIALVGYYWESRDNDDEALILDGHIWQNRFYRFLIKAFDGRGAYQNFPDPSLVDWRWAYYGQNLLWLKKVKNTYDPNRVFDFEQAV